MAAVISLPELDDRALVVEAQVGNRAALKNWYTVLTAMFCGWR